MGEARTVTINGRVADSIASGSSDAACNSHLPFAVGRRWGTGLLSRQASPFHCLQLLSSPATVVHPLIQKVNLKGSGQECPLHTPLSHPHPRRDRGKSPL
jgi:hypothetical protein